LSTACSGSFQSEVSWGRLNSIIEVHIMTRTSFWKLAIPLTVIVAAFSSVGSLCNAGTLDGVRGAITHKKAKWIADETSISGLPDPEKNIFYLV
jgi:hypothetical protein